MVAFLATFAKNCSKLVCCASGRAIVKCKNYRAPVAEVMSSAKVYARQWLRQILPERPQACQVKNYLLDPGSPLSYNNYSEGVAGPKGSKKRKNIDLTLPP